MEKKDKNEELHSRREFFKKAAKAALPVVAAIVLAGSPAVVQAAEKAMGCNNGCTSTCMGGCKGTCSGTCSGQCYTTCTTTCQGACKGACSSGCYTTCYHSSSK